jgi:hypothetical protein
MSALHIHPEGGGTGAVMTAPCEAWRNTACPMTSFSRASGELSYLITSDGNLYQPHICDLTAPVAITDLQLAVGHLYSLPEY